MKMTIDQLLLATRLVGDIIGEARPMTQTGKFLIERMHRKLIAEAMPAVEQNNKLIEQHGEPMMVDDGKGNQVALAGLFRVPPDRMPAFQEAWKPIGAEEIEIDVQPIKIKHFDLGGSVNGAIEARELAVLGDLITE